ncbi:MAG: DUF6457 domain-containing protein [Actinomycetota bacterium]|nr:DUF6457 domain-containing protein [Actinomycetota bacterium]
MSDVELERWAQELAGALGVGVDDTLVDDVLDLARDAAHVVARPAAPVTAYLVGLAVASGQTRADARQTVDRLLAARG